MNGSSPEGANEPSSGQQVVTGTSVKAYLESLDYAHDNFLFRFPGRVDLAVAVQQCQAWQLSLLPDGKWVDGTNGIVGIKQ